MTRENVSYEGTPMLDLLETSRAMPLELAVQPPASRACAACGAPLPISGACGYCGVSRTASTASVLPLPPPVTPEPIVSSPVTQSDRFFEAMASMSMGFWKRLAAYPLVALAIGMGCTCRGVSASSATTLIGLSVLGFVGVYACFRDQRSP